MGGVGRVGRAVLLYTVYYYYTSWSHYDTLGGILGMTADRITYNRGQGMKADDIAHTKGILGVMGVRITYIR